MKAYIAKVIIKGSEDTIKIWATSVQNAIDNIVISSEIDGLIEIMEAQSGNVWDFNGDLNELREMRANFSKDDIKMMAISEGAEYKLH